MKCEVISETIQMRDLLDNLSSLRYYYDCPNFLNEFHGSPISLRALKNRGWIKEKINKKKSYREYYVTFTGMWFLHTNKNISNNSIFSDFNDNTK